LFFPAKSLNTTGGGMRRLVKSCNVGAMYYWTNPYLMAALAQPDKVFNFSKGKV
jgi:hypothetical protein